MNKFAYAYDNRDVRTGVQQQYGADPLRQVNYTYDAVDQLVGENATGGTAGTTYSNAYSYDAMGNRLRRENTQGTTTSMTRSGVNELNQLTSVSTSVDGGPRVTGGMNYDAAGNLTETTGVGGARTLYVYDDADRLFRIEKRDSAGVPVSKSEFIYDYASRKAVSQEFTYTAGAWVQSSEKRRVFDELDVVQERDELNQVTAQLVRDGNISGILARSAAVGASFYSYDGGGNVTLLTDTSGNEVGRYRYDAFGNALEIAGARAAENPYRFSTKELHAASGLYNYGFRFYNSGNGRWLNRDPSHEAGGVNLYLALSNSPINAVDEYGELPRRLGGPLVMSDGSEAMGGAGGKLSPGVAPFPVPLSEFDRMMNERMKGVNPWMDGSAPIGSPMYGMAGVPAIKGTGRTSSRTRGGGGKAAGSPCPTFDKLKIPTHPHFRDRLAQRGGRAITEAKALAAYRNGRLYYNPATRNYIRHDPQSRVSVVTNKASGGQAKTVFEGNPSGNWVPMKWRPGM